MCIRDRDIGSIKGTKLGSEDEMEMKFEDSVPFSALAFKVANDPFVGSLTFIRIYSGTIKTGTAVFNSSKEKEEPSSNFISTSSSEPTFVPLIEPISTGLGK